MSFILDALKKADRERNLNKVPTLATVHIPVHVSGGRMALWVVPIAFLGAAGLVWWLQAPTEPPVPTVQPRPSVAAVPVATPTAPEGRPISEKVASVPPPSVPEPAVPTPGVVSRSRAPRQVDRDSVVSPPASRPVLQRLPQPPAVSIPPEVVDTRPGPVNPPTVLPARPDPQPSVEASPPPSPVTPAAPAAAPPAAPTLKEALSKMTLDVFVYTDVEADRMAVINGRRYLKGQLVEGLYLVEGINSDGVMLRYRDERAILRP